MPKGRKKIHSFFIWKWGLNMHIFFNWDWGWEAADLWEIFFCCSHVFPSSVKKLYTHRVELFHGFINREKHRVVEMFLFISYQTWAKYITLLWLYSNKSEYSSHYYYSGLHIRVCIGKLFSLFPIQNICCGYSKEPSQWDGSFEHPKHMFKLMGKKII